jgi:hypothetical protein
MGEAHPPSPALLLVAAFSRYDAALAWARDRAVEAWGPIALESEAFDFGQTHYYDPTMGDGLRKVFWTFERLIDPGSVVDLKLQTNGWEQDYAALGNHPEPRPLNLDPGYLTLGKLLLASTKDFAHRIYLSRGIFAEVTLFYRRGAWEHHEWTFADYRRADYQEFFSRARDYLHRRLRGETRT